MQAAINERFYRRIERLNSPNYSYMKVLSRQLTVYLFAFTLGILGFYFWDVRLNASVNSSVLAHFSYAFGECLTIGDLVNKVLSVSLTDLAYLFLMFVSAFTFFASFATLLMQFARGFSFGLALGYLILDASGITHFGYAFVAFVVFNVILATLFIVFSAKAVIFSFEYQKRRARRRNTVAFALTALTFMGAVIFADALRCVFSTVYIF